MKQTAWTPMTEEQLADGPGLRALVEYLATDRRPTLRERLTGWQHFTSTEGVGVVIRIGWRAALYDLRHPPEPDDPEEDD